jgi:sulfonate transport system substrate-binding protein
MIIGTRRRLASLSLAAALTGVIAGCGSGSPKTGTTASPQGAPTNGAVAANAATGGVPAGTDLEVGDQQQFLQTLFGASGALSGAPYKVHFNEFDSGPLVDAGFAARKIDIGFMGDLPASLAAKSGLPVRAVAALLPIGASEYLLAKPGITSIAQLKGRPVAYTTGTAEQAFALRALAASGLTQRDVKQVNVALTQLGTVLESGSADASVVSVEQKVDYQQNHPGSKVLATLDTVKPPSYLYFLATTSALGDPAKEAAIGDFTRRLIQASNWEKANKAQYIQTYYVGVQHQTTANAKLILAAGGSYDLVPLDSREESSLQNVVDLLHQAGAVTASYHVAPLFDPSVSARYDSILREVPQND